MTALAAQDEAMGFYDQLPAFIGVVVGAGMSFAATYWMDRTGWRRNQSTRWDERRLSAYLDYSNAVKELVTIADRLASSQPLESGIGPLERTSENLDKLAAAEARRTVVSETLRLFADPDTGTAAREMTRCAWHLCWLAREAPDGDRSEWKRALQRLRGCPRRLHDAGPQELEHCRSLRRENTEASVDRVALDPRGRGRGASSKGNSNADGLIRMAGDRLNKESLLTPKARTDSDSFNNG